MSFLDGCDVYNALDDSLSELVLVAELYGIPSLNEAEFREKIYTEFQKKYFLVHVYHIQCLLLSRLCNRFYSSVVIVSL